MFIPYFCPLASVFIDCVQEEEVEEPYVTGNIGVQSTLCLELVEESLPLGSKVPGDFNPQTFNPCIVDTSKFVGTLET